VNIERGEMSHSKKQELIEELSSESINVLRVKILCRETPGLIASAGLRTKIWSLLLLGSTQTVHKLMDNSSGANIDVPSEMCREGQVLDADVHRTRADVEEFRSTAWRQSVRAILLKFCIEHCVQYKQGMNEILAPFLYLLPPPRHGSLLPYALFEAFIFRYLERFVCVDDSAHLFKAFRCFHLLLLYFDAQLANHLLEQDFPPELYSPQWFLTLYSRSMPLPYVLRLWDMMIAVDDPSFAFFVGLCLLCRKRTDLLLADREGIPEIMVALQFQGEEEIDGIVAKAQEVYRATPKCFLRYLRLCCVSTTELMPLPILHSLSVFNGVATGETTTGGGHSRTHTTTGSSINSSSTSTATSYSLNVNEFDKSLALQAARQCIMLSPQDLVNNLLNPSNVDSNSSTGSSSRTDNAAASAVVANTAGAVVDKVCLLSESTTSEFILPQQYVMIDVRSAKDVAASGGGILPRAIQLDPDLFLTRPEALDIWIQHFDGTRGCPIVLIDLPAARWTGLALWRRLLLGEGDEASSSSSSAGHATQHHQHQQQQRRDEESRYAKEEADVVKADTSRPAVQLARALQAHSFPHVSLLQGGFPALLAELKTRNAGCVEPFVINHESEKWESFLRSTGREYDTSSSSTSSSSSSSSGSSSGSSSTGTGAGLSHRLAHMSSLLAVFIGACWCLSGLIKCAHHHHHQQQLQLPVLQQPFLPAAAAAAAATASASYSKTDVSYPSAVTPSSDGIIHSTVRQKMRLSPPAVNSRSSTSTSISDSNAVGYRSGTVGEERGHAWIEFNNNTDINYDNNDGTSTGIDAEIAAESDAFDSLNDGTGINTFMSAASYSSRATVMRAGHPPPPPPPPPHHHHNSALVILATLLLCGVSVVAVIAVVLAAIYSEFGNDSRNGHMVIVSNGNTDGSAQTYEYSCISRLWKSAINRASLGSKLTKVHTV